MKDIYVTGCGHQNCSDMHSWGPGVRQNYIIHYVLKGAGFLDTSTNTYYIKEGESFLIYPGKVIRYYPEQNNPWEYIWVDFVGEECKQLLDKTEFRVDNPVCKEIKMQYLEKYLKQICDIDIYYKNRWEATGLLLAVLGAYADNFPALHSAVSESTDNRLACTLMLISANYHKADFHVGTICDKLVINRVTLYRLFKSCLFCSPNEYLLNYRLEQSKKLLSQGFSVKQTAMSCGFYDQYYFSKLFKSHERIPPSKWNKNL